MHKNEQNQTFVRTKSNIWRNYLTGKQIIFKLLKITAVFISEKDLRQAIKDGGYTIDKLTKAISIDRSKFYRHLENNEMDKETVDKICSLLKINKDVFVTTESDKGSAKNKIRNSNQVSNLLAQLDLKDEIIKAKDEHIKALTLSTETYRMIIERNSYKVEPAKSRREKVHD